MAYAMHCSQMKKMSIMLLSLLFLTIVAQAEDAPDAELFGGFSFSRGDLDVNMYGWNASIAGTVNNWFSVVGDLSGHYADVGDGLVDAGFNMHSFAVGPQFSARGDSAVGFARVLVGASRLGLGLGCAGAGTARLQFIAGGGVDIPVSDHLAIRAIQADWIHVRLDGDSLNQARVSAGLVVRF